MLRSRPLNAGLNHQMQPVITRPENGRMPAEGHEYPAGSGRSALSERQQIVRPDVIGVRLQEFATGRARADADPGGGTAFVSIETVLLRFDEGDDIRGSVSPPARTVGFRAADMGDALVPGIPVRFVCNLYGSHP
jgi:hypothetical protein